MKSHLTYVTKARVNKHKHEWMYAEMLHLEVTIEMKKMKGYFAFENQQNTNTNIFIR